MGDAAEKLYEDLIRLPVEERRALALRVLATTSDAARTASWETLDELRGVVRLGGNALEDCERLYDG